MVKKVLQISYVVTAKLFGEFLQLGVLIKAVELGTAKVFKVKR